MLTKLLKPLVMFLQILTKRFNKILRIGEPGNDFDRGFIGQIAMTVTRAETVVEISAGSMIIQTVKIRGVLFFLVRVVEICIVFNTNQN